MFLESRCVPKGRYNLKDCLKELDIPQYDPLKIIKKTYGRIADDNEWLEIIEDNKENFSKNSLVATKGNQEKYIDTKQLHANTRQVLNP